MTGVYTKVSCCNLHITELPSKRYEGKDEGHKTKTKGHSTGEQNKDNSKGTYTINWANLVPARSSYRRDLNSNTGNETLLHLLLISQRLSAEKPPPATAPRIPRHRLPGPGPLRR